MKTFAMGGVHPNDNKISTEAAIEQFPVPAKVVVLMNQHLGAPATPIVAKGDKVKVGQLIGEAQAFMCANVHSPVSGTVSKITQNYIDRRIKGKKVEPMLSAFKEIQDEQAAKLK